jgi:putative transcriptional regulator
MVLASEDARGAKTMNRRSVVRAIGASAASLLWLGARGASAASSAEDLDRPLLLVATPDLDGPYRRTAIIAAPFGGKHIGFILNRASDVKLAALFPDSPPAAKAVDPVYIGGPEMSGALFAMTRRDPGGKAIRLFGEVFVTGAAENISRLVEGADEARYFAGFVGWMPGELADEMEDGCWYATEPELAQIFRPDSASMWEELVRKAKAIRA